MNEAVNRHIYRILLGLVIFALLSGTIFYHIVEKFSWLNAYYFCVVTLATVGYGDLTPHTAAGKIFTTFYILTGVGLFTIFVSYRLRWRQDKIKYRHSNKRRVN